MRNRLLAYKGTREQARKKVTKMLERKRFIISDRGEILRFRSGLATPIHCYLKFKEADKVTEAQLYIYTAFWYYIMTAVVGVVPFAIGIYFFGRSGFISAVLMLFGFAGLLTSILFARIMEKQNDVFVSQEMHSLEFF